MPEQGQNDTPCDNKPGGINGAAPASPRPGAH